MSRSKIFKGRPDRLLIDQRAILVKMPDFTDAPPLEEPEPDDFLYDESFVIEDEEEIEAAPLRVFIGTANISEIQEDNSLVESGAMVWDLSAMVESDDDDDFEMFDSFDNDAPAAATIQLGGTAPLVQTAVTPPTQAWALDDADDELEMDDIPSEPQKQAHVSVGRIQMPLAIPEEQTNVEENIEVRVASAQPQTNVFDLDSDEDSEEDWGVFPDEPDDTPVVDVRARQRLGLTNQSPKVDINASQSPRYKKEPVASKMPVRELGDAPATDPILRVQFDEEEDVHEVTEKISVGAMGAIDLDEPPEPTSIHKPFGSNDSDDNIFREGYDVYAHELELGADAPLVVPVEDANEEESPSQAYEQPMFTAAKTDNRFVWIVIALLFVAVLMILILSTN